MRDEERRNCPHGGVNQDCWLCLRAEAERLRGALERIAAEPLACTCRVGDEADEVFADHYDTCVVSIARAALGGPNAK